MGNYKIESEGRRHYIIGDTYSIRTALKSAGCKWDKDRSAWWTGKRETLETFLGRVDSGAIKPIASFHKLSGGVWGVRVSGAPELGSKVDVEGKYGRKTVTISAIVETRDGVSICAIVNEPKPEAKADRPARKARMPGFCRACRGPIVNASHHRAMGGYCGACAFDEYDC